VRLPLAVGKNLPGFGILTRRAEPLSSAAVEFVQSLRRQGSQMEQRALAAQRERPELSTTKKRSRVAAKR
jgi:hypothetical protein